MHHNIDLLIDHDIVTAIAEPSPILALVASLISLLVIG